VFARMSEHTEIRMTRLPVSSRERRKLQESQQTRFHKNALYITNVQNIQRDPQSTGWRFAGSTRASRGRNAASRVWGNFGNEERLWSRSSSTSSSKSPAKPPSLLRIPCLFPLRPRTYDSGPTIIPFRLAGPHGRPELQLYPPSLRFPRSPGIRQNVRFPPIPPRDGFLHDIRPHLSAHPPVCAKQTFTKKTGPRSECLLQVVTRSVLVVVPETAVHFE
jgi:hypothetical protein